MHTLRDVRFVKPILAVLRHLGSWVLTPPLVSVVATVRIQPPGPHARRLTR